MERRAGIEPASAGFADLSVSHFATGAFLIGKDTTTKMRDNDSRLPESAISNQKGFRSRSERGLATTTGRRAGGHGEEAGLEVVMHRLDFVVARVREDRKRARVAKAKMRGG